MTCAPIPRCASSICRCEAAMGRAHCHPERSEGSVERSNRTELSMTQRVSLCAARASRRLNRSFASLRMTTAQCVHTPSPAPAVGRENVYFYSACCAIGRHQYPLTDRRRWVLRSRMPEVLPRESCRCVATWHRGTAANFSHCCDCCHAIRGRRFVSGYSLHPLPAASRISRTSRRTNACQRKSLTALKALPSHPSRCSRKAFSRHPSEKRSFYCGRTR